LKIDRSFVREITSDGDDAAIVRAIVQLGHSLDRQVTAEGVETNEQLEFLRACQCDQAQGFLFSRPMLAADLEPQLLKSRSSPGTSDDPPVDRSGSSTANRRRKGR
jgi:EAL domain-containing protein (putative c-di-GMP-specific phosphodiesterase class I)